MGWQNAGGAKPLNRRMRPNSNAVHTDKKAASMQTNPFAAVPPASTVDFDKTYAATRPSHKPPRTRRPKHAIRAMALAFVQLTVALTSLPHYAYAQCAPDAGEGESLASDPIAAAGTVDDGKSEFFDLVGSGNNGGDDGGDNYDAGGEPSNVAGTDSNGSELAAQASETADQNTQSGSGVVSLSVAGAFASGKAIDITNWGGLMGGRNASSSIPQGSGGSGLVKTGLMEKMGDPIDLKMADKLHVQVDYVSAGAAAVRMARVYHSNSDVNVARVTVPMGTGWHMVYDRSLQLLSATQVRLHRANGRTLDLTWNGSA